MGLYYLTVLETTNPRSRCRQGVSSAPCLSLSFGGSLATYDRDR